MNDNNTQEGPSNRVPPLATGSGWIGFNVNDRARVKLTREGIHHFYAWHERLGIITDGPKIDAAGWYEDELWQIMSIWGERCYMGGPLMFETAIELHIPNVKDEPRGAAEHQMTMTTQSTPENVTPAPVGSGDLFGRFKDMAEQCEMFLFEAFANKYQPAPPDGWFALRSSRRRIFMRLNDGRVPAPEEIQERLKSGEFTEHPLSSPNIKAEERDER